MKSDQSKTISHISFIMDGNGRWAKKRGLPRTAGHSAGVKKAKEVIYLIKELGIPYVSLYTFSKENWKRSTEEVSFLMNLIVKHLEEEFEEYIRNKIKIVHMGDRDGLPDKVLKAIDRVEADTKDYSYPTVYLALNYSGKYDIIQAVNRMIAADEKVITEDTMQKYLLTSAIPDPELIIRTSGEFRVSNYFLWQAAYSEFYVIDKLWPDITREDIIQAIDDYQHRNRRFGGAE